MYIGIFPPHGRTAVAVGVVGGGGVVVSVAPASASSLFVWWGFCWCADPSLLDSLRLGRNALSATLRILLLFVAMRAQNGDQRIFFLYALSPDQTLDPQKRSCL